MPSLGLLQSNTLILTRTGKVFVAGSNYLAELGLGKNVETVSSIVQVETLPKIIDIAAGSEFIIALAEDGSLWAWGTNKELQFGFQSDYLYERDKNLNYTSRKVSVRDTAKGEWLPRQIEICDSLGFIFVAAGTDFSIALDQNGCVWGSGYNRYGAFGIGEEHCRSFKKKSFS